MSKKVSRFSKPKIVTSFVADEIAPRPLSKPEPEEPSKDKVKKLSKSPEVQIKNEPAPSAKSVSEAPTKPKKDTPVSEKKVQVNIRIPLYLAEKARLEAIQSKTNAPSADIYAYLKRRLRDVLKEAVESSAYDKMLQTVASPEPGAESVLLSIHIPSSVLKPRQDALSSPFREATPYTILVRLAAIIMPEQVPKILSEMEQISEG